MNHVCRSGLSRLTAGRPERAWRASLLKAVLAAALTCCVLVPNALAGSVPGFSSQAGPVFADTRQATAIVAVDDAFGCSVAVSGQTALVGMPGRSSVRGSFVGAVYVFTRDGEKWSLKQTLSASDGAAGDRFGGSVAIAGDMALIGAENHDVEGGEQAGAAYVFERSGATWVERAKLTPSDRSSFDGFGCSVALADQTALIGAREAGSRRAGAAYVFVRSATGWIEDQTLTASDGVAGDEFGAAVAISGDTALVGAPHRDSAQWTDGGAAYVFVRSAATWAYQAELAGAGGQRDYFGAAIALSSDAALIGAPGSDSAGQENPGLASFFERSDAIWCGMGSVDASGFTRLGCAVALNGDTALVGEDRANGGIVHVLQRSEAGWSTVGALSAKDRETGDDFGRAVALSGDTALIGAPGNDAEGKDNPGAAYIFSRSNAAWLQQTPLFATGTRARPTIKSFQHHYSRRGQLITVRGTNFGTARGSSYVKVGAVKCSRYRSWTDTRVITYVPLTAKLGPARVRVTTKSGTSNAVECIVMRRR